MDGRLDEEGAQREVLFGEGGGASRKEEPKRVTWGSKLDFIMSALGVAVGLGNLWRFPYLCYRNGGGAFLIPYVLCLLCAGIPMLTLEIALGQYMRSGCLDAWKIVPGFQGIGIGTLGVSFMSTVYYIVILAWTTYYMYMSLTDVLPWSHCDSDWNTDRCFVSNHGMNQTNVTITYNYTASGNNSSGNAVTNATAAIVECDGPADQCAGPVDSVVEFWERKVLQRSAGIQEPGHVVPELALSLLFAWLVVFFCIFKGVRWSGKVAYVTVIFPYVLLFVLMIRGVTLDGASDGIIYYLKPDFSQLGNAQVWVDGLSQVFFSNAVATGSLIMLGSYNPFKNNFYRDCIVISFINSGTSFVGGFAVFSVLGFMAREQNVHISKVANSGPGLAFIAYPKAVIQMPGAPIWAFLFFLMIFMLGIDSQFVTAEGFLTPITDRFPRIFYRSRNRILLTIGLCVTSYLIGLIMITNGGVYVFELFDFYAANGIVLLWICFCQAIVVGWIFGADRFYDCIEMMTGARIGPWMKIGWKFLTPVITMGTLLFAAATFEPLKYNDNYEYPVGTQIVGAFLGLGIILAVPVYFLYSFLKQPGTFRQRWYAISAASLKPHQIPGHWKQNGTKAASLA